MCKKNPAILRNDCGTAGGSCFDQGRARPTVAQVRSAGSAMASIDPSLEYKLHIRTVSSRNICTGSVAFSAGKAGVFRVKAVTRQRQAA